MSSYANIWDILNSVSGGQYIGDNLDDLSTDQRLKVAEVMALISISEELSAINPQNTTSTRDGRKYNGWGMPQPD